MLYGYYHFFLRNKKFHQYNRFYLLSITLLSLIVPLMDIPVYFNSKEDIPAVYQLLSPLQVSNNATFNSANQFLTWQALLRLLYGLVVAAILIRFIISLLQLRGLLKKYPSQEMNNISFVNTNENGTPYSFFRWLFWNKNISLESADGQQVFRHEMFHIQQKHSWDIVFTELLTAVFWINPFFHLLKKELKTIHEFLADQFAAGKENNWEYAELLVMQILQTRQRLVNPFFHNQIKRRIAMITNYSTTRYQYLRKLMVLPAIALTVSLISVSCRTENDLKSPEAIIIEERVIPDQEIQADGQPRPQNQNNNAIIEEVVLDKIFTTPEIEAAFKGGQTEWRNYLQKNLNPGVPVDNGAPEGTYTVLAQFIVDENGNISDLKTLTNHGYGMEEEVLRIITKGPKWLPAMQNGKKVKAYRKQPVTFQIEAE